MKKLTLNTMLGVAAAAAVLVSTGCASTAERRTAGAYLDDTGTTARVKTALLRDPVVRGTAVNVDVFRGNATLSGFVASEEQKERAAEIARTTPGVDWVQNNLAVKAELPSEEQAEAMGRADAEAEIRTERGAATDQPTATSDDWKRATPPADRDIEGKATVDIEDGEARADIRTGEQEIDTAARAQAGMRPDIEIQMQNGRATLRGTVASEAEKNRIEQKLLEVPGVRSVNNELQVSDTTGAGLQRND